MPGFMVGSGNRPDFVKEALEVTVPTLIAPNKNNPWTGMSMVRDYFDALAVEKELMLLDIEKPRLTCCSVLEPKRLRTMFLT
ncbi:MAG: hypothetical protein V6Z86_09490 [Hyphomicrobiales bacterium]